VASFEKRTISNSKKVEADAKRGWAISSVAEN
jgi:hypothetical protein